MAWKKRGADNKNVSTPYSKRRRSWKLTICSIAWLKN